MRGEHWRRWRTGAANACVSFDFMRPLICVSHERAHALTRDGRVPGHAQFHTNSATTALEARGMWAMRRMSTRKRFDSIWRENEAGR